MMLNDLLLNKKIEPREVLVFRHRPREPELNRVFPWLAAEKPDVFNAYQQTHGERVERALQKAKYVASFLGHVPGKALFIGLYSVGTSRSLTREDYWRVPAYIEMKAFGMEGFGDNEARTSVLWFDLMLTDFYNSWKGKLVLDWTGPERSWWRWGDRNDFNISAILEESVLDTAMPRWDALDLTWDQLRVLPSRLRAQLSQWRGIYYIFDTSDRKGYVGSAYGEQNLLGRWLAYATAGHGGNRQLRGRDPRNFRFTILQRLSPDEEPANVIAFEVSWKERLHTRVPYGLNDN